MCTLWEAEEFARNVEDGPDVLSAYSLVPRFYEDCEDPRTPSPYARC